MRYRYVKSPIKDFQTSTLSLPAWLPKSLPLLLGIIGLVLIASVIIPIFSYQFLTAPRFSNLVSPLPEENPEMAVLGEAEVDMSQVSNWFPKAPKLPPKPSKITHYSLSIPKLKIEDVVVQIGGEDLKEALIHYQGTAFPGQFGNAVVFGHSVLPQFFNPKNYLTIFSTLPTLKKGDEIFVNFDGVLYKYVIEEMTEVKPDDISILEQRYDDSYLMLITCVPPGTYLKRLAVRARLTRL